jgi:hypothetical protein
MTMLRLNKNQWSILDILLCDEEPLETADEIVKEVCPESTPCDTLNELYALYQMGFVVIKQQPITALGQDFARRTIEPSSPQDILGDLQEYFEDYCKTRKWLWELTLGDSPGGVPFGIWIEITPSGREEAEKPDYKDFWPPEE